MTRIVNTSTAPWALAKKTQPIRALHMAAIFENPTIAGLFRLNTLEGLAEIGADNFLCLGSAGDCWQQTSAALQKKYDISAPDALGWVVATPKPENEVEFFQFEGDGDLVQGTWGQTIEGVGEKLQAIVPGDYICRQTYDHADQWVVRKALFENTYSVL
jgi:hypothetical protein